MQILSTGFIAYFNFGTWHSDEHVLRGRYRKWTVEGMRSGKYSGTAKEGLLEEGALVPT